MGKRSDVEILVAGLGDVGSSCRCALAGVMVPVQMLFFSSIKRTPYTYVYTYLLCGSKVWDPCYTRIIVRQLVYRIIFFVSYTRYYNNIVMIRGEPFTRYVSCTIPHV